MKTKILLLGIIGVLAIGVCLLPRISAAKSKPEVVKNPESCPLSIVEEAKANQVEYEVYSPVGDPSIKPITQAPRLDTLNGKTIAVVGGSFMANITHPEIKRLILKNYPKANVLLLNEIGSAGPYPQPGVKRQQKEDFERNLKEMKVDAVISGNGGCGLCTPKEEGSCIVAEKMGIPCVMIAAPSFVAQAKTVARTNGVSVQRVAEYPGAFAAHTPEELVSNTQKILWPQIVEGLTKLISQEELSQNTPDKKSGKTIAYAGSYEDVNNYFNEQGWSDGLPVVPPTKEKVEEFLKFTALDADTVIGEIPVAYRKVTPFHVAVVGVMSGCKPEYMPILIAFTKAMLDGNFRKTLSSTHAWTPFVWLNGPLARQLNIDSSQGEISAANNKKVGRFIDLALINLGGYDIKQTRMGTFGYLSAWAMAEDEKSTLAVGWQPYHVQQGFKLNDNTLTATSSLSWGNNLTPASSDADKILELMAWDAVEKEQFALGAGTPFVYRTILITPYVARDLAAKYKDKNALEKALVNTARRPLEERAYANFWANPGSSFEGKNYTLSQHQNKLAKQEGAQTTATPAWLAWSDKKQLDTVPVMELGKTAIIVTGDDSRNKTMTVPGGGQATIKIELPANWDELMQTLGYEPIQKFYLDENALKSTAVQVKPVTKKTPKQYTNPRGNTRSESGQNRVSTFRPGQTQQGQRRYSSNGQNRGGNRRYGNN